MPSDFVLPGVLTIPGLASGINSSMPKSDSPQKTQEAAAQFEALLVGQILKSTHEEGGWLGTGEDQTAGSAMQMADEYFARALTARGGLGLAKMIAAGLQKVADDTLNRSNPGNSQVPGEAPNKP
jgi:Rod binding domain-containing protein